MKRVYLLLCSLSILALSHGQTISYSQKQRVRQTLLTYCENLATYARGFDAEAYNQVIAAFSHREVKVYNDLAYSYEEVAIHNYMTQLQLQIPTGYSITFTYSPDPQSAPIRSFETNRGTDAQITLRKTIRGGRNNFRKTVDNVIFISLDDYKITGIFDEAPEPISRTKTIHLDSDPSGATVYLNNNYKGTTPLNLELSFGKTYSARLQKNRL